MLNKIHFIGQVILSSQVPIRTHKYNGALTAIDRKIRLAQTQVCTMTH